MVKHLSTRFLRSSQNQGDIDGKWGHDRFEGGRGGGRGSRRDNSPGDIDGKWKHDRFHEVNQDRVVRKSSGRGGGRGGRRQGNSDGQWQHDMYEEEEEAPRRRGGMRSDGGGGGIKARLGEREVRVVGGGSANGVLKPLLDLGVSNKRIVKERPANSRSAAAGARRVTKEAGGASQSQKLSVRTLLQSLGLDKYVDIFARQEIDIYVLRKLTENDLEELGIPMGPRKKIVEKLSQL